MIEIIPHERDKKAAQTYKFMRWFIRKHKKLIKDESDKAIFLMTAYGEGGMDKLFKEWESKNLEP